MVGVEKIEALSAKEHLLREMRRTKGARFNAAQRLERRDRARTRNTAYASAYVIVLTLLPIFFSVHPAVAAAINLGTVALSLVILASSLLQSSHADPVKAEQLHRCAIDINSLRRELRADPDGDDAQRLADYTRRYDDVLKRYPVNHEDVDFERYKLDHPDEFPGFTKEDKKTAKEVIRRVDWLSSGASAMTAAALGLTLAASSTDVLQGLRLLVETVGSWWPQG